MHARGGFSIVEAIIAIFIALMAVLGTLGAMLSAAKLDEDRADRTKALRLAERRMAEIVGFDYGEDIEALYQHLMEPQNALFSGSTNLDAALEAGEAKQFAAELQSMLLESAPNGELSELAPGLADIHEDLSKRFGAIEDGATGERRVHYGAVRAERSGGVDPDLGTAAVRFCVLVAWRSRDGQPRFLTLPMTVTEFQ